VWTEKKIWYVFNVKPPFSINPAIWVSLVKKHDSLRSMWELDKFLFQLSANLKQTNKKSLSTRKVGKQIMSEGSKSNQEIAR